MVLKPFRSSHPLVLFAYFLSVMIVSIIQQNYYIIVLVIICALIMDYYFNANYFLKILNIQ